MINALTLNIYIYIWTTLKYLPKFLLCVLIFLSFYNELGRGRLYINNIIQNSRVKTQVYLVHRYNCILCIIGTNIQRLKYANSVYWQLFVIGRDRWSRIISPKNLNYPVTGHKKNKYQIQHTQYIPIMD